MPGEGFSEGVAARRDMLGATYMERPRRRVFDLGMLAALDRMHDFRLHFRAALVNMAFRDELKQALLQIAICGGRKVLAEEGGNK